MEECKLSLEGEDIVAVKKLKYLGGISADGKSEIEQQVGLQLSGGCSEEGGAREKRLTKGTKLRVLMQWWCPP